MGFLRKAFIGYTSYMSVYGFSRGYRSEYRSEKKELLMNRIKVGLLNGMLYAIPIWNVCHLVKLVNRIEIHNKCLNPRDYSAEYQEVSGECYDTF